MHPELAGRAEQVLLREVHVAPTLMKYAEPSAYELESRRELSGAAAELLGRLPIDPAPVVDLLEDEPLEIELATTLLYQYDHHSYRQIRSVVEGLSEKQRSEIIGLGMKHRGRFDEVARAFNSGQRLSLRHPHGHRRLSRYASPSPLRADHAGLHDSPRLRHAAGDRSRRTGAAVFRRRWSARDRRLTQLAARK